MFNKKRNEKIDLNYTLNGLQEQINVLNNESNKKTNDKMNLDCVVGRIQDCVDTLNDTMVATLEYLKCEYVEEKIKRARYERYGNYCRKYLRKIKKVK